MFFYSRIRKVAPLSLGLNDFADYNENQDSIETSSHFLSGWPQSEAIRGKHTERDSRESARIAKCIDVAAYAQHPRSPNSRNTGSSGPIVDGPLVRLRQVRMDARL